MPLIPLRSGLVPDMAQSILALASEAVDVVILQKMDESHREAYRSGVEG
jgi:hypothetical protein